ncbi:Uu.00g098080.m01.CDS01 [Anthostomella pinea]|uniref:Uu.00g098080.m01.CDS01 n=1 Tax=Anthostomella pinea TaxID=933095 RepID=A0AAI8VCJ4_9PEZI|nr:Uu.00g098080.m01.CDS01 [Anthostomella pinea]
MESPAARSSLPAPRQKNCTSCVQVKRRCDRRTPVCSRCAERKLDCIYSKTKHNTNDPPSLTEALPFATPVGSQFGPGLSFDMGRLGEFPPDPQPNGATDPTSASVIDAFGSEDAPMGNFMDLLGNCGSDQWLVLPEENPFFERPSTPTNHEIDKAYDKMAPLCDDIEPWHIHDPKSPLHYLTNRIKSFVTDLATQNATPFLHRYLYRDHAPQCILTCFSTSVLYAHRTPANTGMVMRAIHSSVRELIDAEGSRGVLATPTEKLGRAQALFLYQIIRLFDGDVILRGQGERDMWLLETWLGELCKIRENLGDFALLGDGVARMQLPPEWERWIFAESVRRTIFMAYSVIALYGLMKDPGREGLISRVLPFKIRADAATDGLGPWAYVHRWTISRPLWEAESSFEFNRKWKESPHFVIANYSFERFLEFGRGEDVDDFAEIVLSVYIGVDATKEFIAARPT